MTDNTTPAPTDTGAEPPMDAIVGGPLKGYAFFDALGFLHGPYHSRKTAEQERAYYKHASYVCAIVDTRDSGTFTIPAPLAAALGIHR